MVLGIETKKDLRNQLEEAERRAAIHFTKVNRIENILKNQMKQKKTIL